jgi:hypothetical protein
VAGARKSMTRDFSCDRSADRRLGCPMLKRR